MKLIKTIFVTTSMLVAAAAFAAKPTVENLTIEESLYYCDGSASASVSWTGGGNSGKGVIVDYTISDNDTDTPDYHTGPIVKIGDGFSEISLAGFSESTGLYPPLMLGVIVYDRQYNPLDGAEAGPVSVSIEDCTTLQ